MDKDPMAIIHLYCAISNLNILAFITESTYQDVAQACSGGNENTFVDLISSHVDYIESTLLEAPSWL